MRRVRRPKDKKELFDALTEKSKGGIFDSYKDAMLFAAALGANRNEKQPFEKTLEQIDYSIFQGKSDNDVLVLMIGVFGNKDFEIISSEKSDERLTLFEEYANKGLEIIQDKMKELGSNAFNAVLNLIQETQSKETEEIAEEGDFPSIMKELSSSE
jgi:dnd system-associated protein 4